MGDESLDKRIADIYNRKNREEIKEFELAKEGIPVNPFPDFPKAYEVGIALWLGERNIKNVQPEELLSPEVLYSFKLEMQAKAYIREYALLKNAEEYAQGRAVLKKIGNINNLINHYLQLNEYKLDFSPLPKS